MDQPFLQFIRGDFWKAMLYLIQLGERSAEPENQMDRWLRNFLN